MAILEYVRLEFEHEQQYKPCSGVYRRGIGIAQIAQSNTIGVEQLVGSVFLSEERVDVPCKESVKAVLEYLE